MSKMVASICVLLLLATVDKPTFSHCIFTLCEIVVMNVCNGCHSGFQLCDLFCICNLLSGAVIPAPDNERFVVLNAAKSR